jgi:glyoxylase-like metal-dependent hydrolase (beta-lactamase superfamily II)
MVNPAVAAKFFPARAEIVLPPGVVGPESFSFNVNAFVVRRGVDIALVDTLMRPDHVDIILGALGNAGAGFADITHIVLTHHHPDHSGGLVAIRQRCRQAHILCGAGDIDALRSATGISADAVTGGDTVLGLDVVPTPGHTPGHLCLFDEYSSTMLLGDVVGNIGALQRTPAQFTENDPEAEATLRALAERDFANALPSHGDPLLGGASAALLRLATWSS